MTARLMRMQPMPSQTSSAGVDGQVRFSVKTWFSAMA